MPSDSTETEGRNQIWLRGLFMVIFAILFNIAQGLLVACAVAQFLWMLFAKEKNRAVADFGEGLGRWMQATYDYLPPLSTGDRAMPPNL